MFRQEVIPVDKSEIKTNRHLPVLQKLGWLGMSAAVAIGVVRYSVDYATDRFKQTSQEILTDAQNRAKETGGQLILNFNTETAEPMKIEVRGVKEKAGSLVDRFPEPTSPSTSTTTTDKPNPAPGEAQTAGNTVFQPGDNNPQQSTSSTTTTTTLQLLANQP